MVLLLLQVFVFSNIKLSSLGIVPAFFILYIILLPFETPNWAILLLAFLLGLSIDIFTDTLGINASSTVFIAFIRPLLLKTISPRDGYEAGTFPRVHYMGMPWFFKYSLIIVFLHQMLYYILVDFGFDHFGVMLLKAFIGTVITLILIIISQFIVYRK